ncbi:MAG: hypothetical protein P8020_16665 [Acidobacteriota bacterium]
MTSNRIDRLFSSWDFRVLLPRRRVGLALACLAILSVSTSLLVGQHSEGHDTRALHEDPRLTDGQIAPLLVGLGSGHLADTTSSPRSQLFYDQGLRLAY